MHCVVKGRLLGAERRRFVLMRTYSFFGWMNPFVCNFNLGKSNVVVTCNRLLMRKIS